MSENKDFEIKKLCNAIRNYAECELDYGTLKTLKMIEDSASRMAAEIGRLKTQGKVACELFDELKILQKENFDLKAELEKRRKVVFCKDCTRAFCTNITLALKCRIWRVQVSPNAFCSRGQRRESEVRK